MGTIGLKIGGKLKSLRNTRTMSRDDVSALTGVGKPMLSQIERSQSVPMDDHVLEFACVGVENGGTFSAEHTGRGSDVSPEFLIKDLSPNARTIAITLEDLTHPIKNFTHWIIWNIPAADRIKAQIPAGADVPGMSGTRQGIGYGFHKYAGPRPPKGKTHTYRFTVYALDCEIELSVHSTKRAFLKKAEKHMLQKGSITSSFEGGTSCTN